MNWNRKRPQPIRKKKQIPLPFNLQNYCDRADNSRTRLTRRMDGHCARCPDRKIGSKDNVVDERDAPRVAVKPCADPNRADEKGQAFSA